jgi:hypothetical protein
LFSIWLLDTEVVSLNLLEQVQRHFKGFGLQHEILDVSNRLNAVRTPLPAPDNWRLVSLLLHKWPPTKVERTPFLFLRVFPVG